MSGIAPLIILVLAMLIQFALQLTPGSFAIFYHAQLGKTSAKRADDISLFFILGVEFFVSVVWLLVYVATYAIFCTVPDFNTTVMPWLMAGVMGAEAIVSFCWYFRRGKKTTALFVPRSLVRQIIYRAEKSKSRMDAVLLGFCVGLGELVISLPLFVVSALQVLQIITVPPYLVIILYILICMAPLFAVRTLFRTHHNLAEIQRTRVRMKQQVRLCISLGFLAMAAMMVYVGATA